MKKKYVMAPGPTPIPSEVLAEAGQPIIHHRTPQFQEILKASEIALQKIFRTNHPVIIFPSVGTGAMESAVANLTSPGETVLVASSGHFGNRWKEICQAFQVQVDHYETEWGKPIDSMEVQKRLKANSNIHLVFSTFSETSTGVRNDIQALAKVTQAQNALLVVDAISGLGAMPLETDLWGVDVVVAGSQKGFMIPPGLSFVSVSPKALEKSKNSKSPKYYFSYEKSVKKLVEGKSPDTPFTPAITLVIQLRKALELIEKEGIENVWKRHEILARMTRTAVKALGLPLLAPDSPSDALTAVSCPEGLDGGAVSKMFRDDYGISIAGGQGKLTGKIFRMGHLGYIDSSDVILGIATLEMVLNRLGKSVPLGAGVKTVQEIILKENIKF